METNMQWFYEQGGQPAGPVAEDSLRELLQNGALPPDCRVWCAAFGDEWRRASEVPEFCDTACEDAYPDTPNRDLMVLARERLAEKWWPAVGAFLIVWLAGMGIQHGAQSILSIPFIVVMIPLSMAAESGSVTSIAIFIGFMAVFMVFMMTVSMTFCGMLEFGARNYFLKLARRDNPKIAHLFAAFSKNWKRVAWTYWRMVTFVGLWMLLFVIPGYVAMLSYSQTFYILADHPELTAREAMERSKVMMLGYRWKLFCLCCRFIGWSFLCLLTCGVGFLFLMPYMLASFACFYDSVKTRAVFSTTPTPT